MTTTATVRDDDDGTRRNTRQQKNSAIRNVIIMALVLATVLVATSYFLKPLLPDGYVRYVHVAEVAIAGYIIIELFGNIVKKLLMTHSEMAARSIKSVIRIAGAVIVMAVIISYLSQDPVIAASLSTISGIVIGFAASNLIGNAIAGIYLAIARPFRIGDKIKVFGEEGTVIDIGILYTRLLLDSDGDHMLASNSSMVSSNIILKKGKAKGTGKSEGNETGTGKSSASSDQ